MELRKIFSGLSLILISFSLHAQTYITATGGSVTIHGNYKIHTFFSSDTFRVTSGSGNVEVLVVAGGGGGGTGGGGGGGGLIHNTSFGVTTTAYAVTVGAGGALGTGGADGTNGSNSAFSSLTAIGGGGGGGFPNNGKSGGSGGGAGSSGGATTGGTNTSGQGYAGADGIPSYANYPSGGGGGAGGAGHQGTTSKGGDGGDGLAVSITDSSIYYAGGGGGGNSNANNSSGGLGGGGGCVASVGVDGTANTGGGGGGARFTTYSGGNGGSGIVIIRYQFQGSGGGGDSTGTDTTWIRSGDTIHYNNGNVGIGTSHPQTKLSVNGEITAKKLTITQTGWADYVFDKNYKLSTLEETENFIKLHQHLQGIPSAIEIEKNGLDVGNGQALLLKKIEELTLIIIQQNKRINKLEKRINTKRK